MKIVYALVFGIVLGGCASKKIQAPKELTWEVADTFIPCEGVSAQNCIQVREPGGEWVPLYSSIENFNYQEGYSYTIRVKETVIENPPADGSSKKYELITITTQKNTSDIVNGVPILDGNFTVTHINGQVAPIKDLTIRIDKNARSISGFSGCNTYNLTFKQKGFLLRFSHVISTRMYCEKEAQIEKEFLITYVQGNRFTLEGDILKIYENETQILEAKRLNY